MLDAFPLPPTVMSELSHVDRQGLARMVDVSAKPETPRQARATGTIRMRAETLHAIRGNLLVKGDVLSVARIAGVMAAKRTAELVPLCHPIALTDVNVELTLDETIPGVRADVMVRTTGRTGVEIEAMTAVLVTLVTVYDMAKAVDREMVISDVMLVEKSGGRSGSWSRR